MSDRRDALLLEVIKKRDQLVPGFGLLAAGLVERCLVDPDPVGRVDVDRSRDPVAVIFGELLQRGRNDLVPAFFGCHIIEIAERAFLGPVENVEAEHLHGGRCIAGRDTRTQHGHGFSAATAGNRHVDPGNALAFKVFLQHFESGSFATRCPPVQHLHAFLGMSDHAAKPHHQGSYCSRCQKLAHRFLPLASCIKQMKPSAFRSRSHYDSGYPLHTARADDPI